MWKKPATSAGARSDSGRARQRHGGGGCARPPRRWAPTGFAAEAEELREQRLHLLRELDQVALAGGVQAGAQRVGVDVGSLQVRKVPQERTEVGELLGRQTSGVLFDRHERE